MNIQRIKKGLCELHSNQSGALALLCLAGILIILMMGMMIFDVTEVANEKVHIQASADASAHSQASVTARTMNMVAFANVGKRINIGYVAAYDAILGWMGWLVGAGWVLTALCAVIGVFAPPVLKACAKMAKVMAGATCVYALEEVVDRAPHWNDVVTKTFGPEIRGFNNYQQFMADITPYWAWSQGVWRGFVNRAPITVGYPAPKGNVTYSAQVPIRPRAGNNWDTMCEKADRTPTSDILSSFSGEGDGFLSAITQQADRWYMFGDFLLKNGISVVGGDAQGSGGNWSDAGTVGPGDLGSEDDMDGGVDGMNCGELEELANQSGWDMDPPKHCDDDDDDECEEERGSLDMGGQIIDLGMDCATDAIKDALGDGLGELADAVDCSDINAAGAYGAIFLSGTLALLINPTQMLDDKGGLIAGIIRRLLPRSFRDRCTGRSRSRFAQFQNDGAAWELMRDDWLMNSSTLIYAYRPNASRNTQSKEKYNIVGGDVNHGFLNSASSGVWALSRGEITWQGGGEPNLWESEWGARIRPVALQGEWESYGEFNIWAGLEEIQAEMFSAIVVAHGADLLTPGQADGLLTRPYDLESISDWQSVRSLIDEVWATERSFEPMEDRRMDGIMK